MAPLVPSVDDGSRTEGGADEDGGVVREAGSGGGGVKEDILVSQRTCGAGGQIADISSTDSIALGVAFMVIGGGGLGASRFVVRARGESNGRVLAWSHSVWRGRRRLESGENLSQRDKQGDGGGVRDSLRKTSDVFFRPVDWLENTTSYSAGDYWCSFIYLLLLLLLRSRLFVGVFPPCCLALIAPVDARYVYGRRPVVPSS